MTDWNARLLQPTTARVLTPAGRGAVATISVSGSAATELVAEHFSPACGKTLIDMPLHRLVFGRFASTTDSAEEVVVVRTSDTEVEIHCHGGRFATEAILNCLTNADAAVVDWANAPCDNATGAIEYAARVALARARTERTAAVLLDQYRGALRTRLASVLQAMRDGVLSRAGEQLEQLQHRASFGKHLTEPWKVVLTGPPNVGKSSLINAILGYSRAIVHHVPGTTRDVVTASTVLEGWPIELADTAGVRADATDIEAAGITLARERLASADCVVLVLDPFVQPTSEQQTLLKDRSSSIVVRNKLDLAATESPTLPKAIQTCALDGRGIAELLRSIVTHILPGDVKPGMAVPFTQEQVDGISAAGTALERNDVGTACAVIERMLS